MSKQLINPNYPNDLVNVGSNANDKTGDPLRTAFTKINDAIDRIDANFTEVYAATDADVQIPAQANNGGKVLSTDGTTLSWIPQQATGDIGFNNTSIYSLSGVIVENADLTHGATASLIIPSNGSQSQPVSLNNIYGQVKINTSAGPGTPSTWTFSPDGKLALPTGGDIVDSTGTSVLGGANFNQTLNTNSNVTFNQIQLSTTRTSSSGYVNLAGGVTGVIYTIDPWMVSTKLVICVESQLDSDGTFTDHTQTCEATVAATYNYTNEPVISVYGLVYTSPNPLATFTVRRGAGNVIEIVATNTQGTKTMTFSIYATQFISTRD